MLLGKRCIFSCFILRADMYFALVVCLYIVMFGDIGGMYFFGAFLCGRTFLFRGGFTMDYEKLFYTLLNTTEKIARELKTLHDEIGVMYFDMKNGQDESDSPENAD